MSPRAAWRLESLGFTEVDDYSGGKANWGAFGLPLEGTLGPRAGEHVRTDVPTCSPQERLQEVRARLRASEWDTCLVVNEHQVVLGRLGRRALAREDDVTAEEAMSAGPSTVRPNVTVEAMLERMRRQNLSTVVVTRLDGVLLGLFRREHAERVVAGATVLPPAADGDTV
jgi:CBS domain-containing protein